MENRTQNAKISILGARRMLQALADGETDPAALAALADTRLSLLIWIILHQGVSYEERGPAVSQKSKRRRTSRMIRELRSLGYELQPLSVQTGNA
jgi:hypothetical protein